MIIELRGMNFINKGAELMLYSILEKIKQEVPDAMFVMEEEGPASIQKQRELGIFTKLRIKNSVEHANRLGKFIPKIIRRKSGYILENEINVILDGSGFAFGDQWGARKAGFRLADHIDKWKKQGKKVVLLPQAFGPFTNDKLAEKMQLILNKADLIFARDVVSFNYLNNLSPGNNRVILRPDFTNLIKGIKSDSFNGKDHQVAIIPNFKMIEATTPEEGKMYFDFLKSSVEVTQKLGSRPFFLIHEGIKDKQIAKDINARLNSPIPIITEEHPLKLKGIISECKAVITSRFHGLVSALSQAVPCLATGWSHKYEMLLGDYDYTEGLIEVNISQEQLEEAVKSIVEDQSSNTIRLKLAQKAEEQKQLSQATWEKVFSVIKR